MSDSYSTEPKALVSVPTQERIAALRQKARENGQLTLDETREVIAMMRGDRIRAATVSAKSRTVKADGAAAKAKSKLPVDSDALLGELDGL